MQRVMYNPSTIPVRPNSNTDPNLNHVNPKLCL